MTSGEQSKRDCKSPEQARAWAPDSGYRLCVPAQRSAAPTPALPSPPLSWPQGLHGLDLQGAGPQGRAPASPRSRASVLLCPKASCAQRETLGPHRAATWLG